jgi:hypothetical protein
MLSPNFRLCQFARFDDCFVDMFGSALQDSLDSTIGDPDAAICLERIEELPSSHNRLSYGFV